MSGLYAETRASACVYCNKDDHFSSKCATVTSHESRKAILRRKGRCFICLDSRHIAKDCTSTYVCRRCKKVNIIFLYAGQIYRPVDPKKGKGTVRTEDRNKLSEGNKEFVGHANCDEHGILLQTARVDVSDVHNNEQVYTRLLFDSGSQRSYISEKVRSRLKLKTVRSEKVIIRTFGQGEESEVQKLDIVQFKIKNKHDANFTCVEALCVPTICSPLTNQCMLGVHECREFKRIKFADCEDHQTNGSNRPVGILVGIDYY